MSLDDIIIYRKDFNEDLSMTREELNARKNEALGAFSRFGEVCSSEPYGNGHINDTFLVKTKNKKYVLQRINTSVFTKPYEVMSNIEGVTEHIRKKAREEGKDDSRVTLTVLKTDNGQTLFEDSCGSVWRAYDFINKTIVRDKVESAEDFRICGEAFGAFQCLLADYNADSLHETIVNFHNTPVRYETLKKAVEQDVCCRADSVRAEIDFALARYDLAKTLTDAHARGELPLRVTHNDTKLNNVLFDKESGEVVAVIDLDTVMPGFSVTDFGDSIRFGASTAAEDERDLSLVSLDLDLFEAHAKGFIAGCGGRLKGSELDLLPEGAMLMTYECGMRFLTDYLEGDVYFKIHREGHNLDRCRAQFALLSDMENKRDKMHEIINKLK